MSKKIDVQLSESEITMLVTVIRMGGWHKRKEYPKGLRDTNNIFVLKMHKILKKLESAIENDD
jgi:hypothetical protein